MGESEELRGLMMDDRDGGENSGEGASEERAMILLEERTVSSWNTLWRMLMDKTGSGNRIGAWEDTYLDFSDEAHSSFAL